MSKEQTDLDELIEFIDELEADQVEFKTVANFETTLSEQIINKIKEIQSRSTHKVPVSGVEDPTLDDPTSVEGNENIIEQ